MDRKKETAVFLWVALSSGCTMGLGETTRFVTRNVSLSGELADGEFALEDGVATVVVDELGPEFGVMITLELTRRLGVMLTGGPLFTQAGQVQVSARAVSVTMGAFLQVVL